MQNSVFEFFDGIIDERKKYWVRFRESIENSIIISVIYRAHWREKPVKLHRITVTLSSIIGIDFPSLHPSILLSGTLNEVIKSRVYPFLNRKGFPFSQSRLLFFFIHINKNCKTSIYREIDRLIALISRMFRLSRYTIMEIGIKTIFLTRVSVQLTIY